MVILAIFMVGCGPIQSTARISNAEVALERARVNDAEEHSPYEYFQAQHFLHKAKEEWGYSNFEISRDYAIQARRAANAAVDNTREAPWQGHPLLGKNATAQEAERLIQQRNGSGTSDQ